MSYYFFLDLYSNIISNFNILSILYSNTKNSLYYNIIVSL